MNGRVVRNAIRWIIGIIVVVHGLTHLLGAAQGFGWADVTQLDEPISDALGAGWLAAAALTTAAGVLLVVRARWGWIIGAGAIVISQVVIITSWADARVGTLANVILLVAVLYGYASQGPRSASAEYRRHVGAALAAAHPGDLVTGADLDTLPATVAAYVRRSGALGQPRVTNFRARAHGRIRGGATKPWMTFTSEQVNTYGPQPSRLFFINATMFGLPIDVLHVLVAGSATMRARACSLITMVNASGPDMDRAETVTLFNDMCILAPAALVDAPIIWHVVDDQHVNGTFTNGSNTITAELIFNDDHELVDFVSDDRLAASSDGTTFTRQRWSTPISGYGTIGSRRIGTIGEGRWSAPDPGGDYAYLEFNLDEISYNASNSADHTSSESTHLGRLPVTPNGRARS